MSDSKTKEEEKASEYAAKAYSSRLTLLKRAQEFTKQGEIPKAVECYGQYLNCLALYLDVDESKLSPAHFDTQKDLTELLLISNSYWELAKAYDRSPRLQQESIRCLKQFVLFTVGFKFQHVNAQMVKKFVRSRKAHNPKAFQQVLDRVKIDSKGCYIATYCYGEYHPVTNDFRQWRDLISSNPVGRAFIETYYFISPMLINLCQKKPKLGRFLKNFIFLPFLNFLILFLRKNIL